MPSASRRLSADIGLVPGTNSVPSPYGHRARPGTGSVPPRERASPADALGTEEAKDKLGWRRMRTHRRAVPSTLC